MNQKGKLSKIKISNLEEILSEKVKKHKIRKTLK
jgi:ribosomal protein L20A (L18A)